MECTAHTVRTRCSRPAPLASPRCWTLHPAGLKNSICPGTAAPEKGQWNSGNLWRTRYFHTTLDGSVKTSLEYTYEGQIVLTFLFKVVLKTTTATVRRDLLEILFGDPGLLALMARFLFFQNFTICRGIKMLQRPCSQSYCSPNFQISKFAKFLHKVLWSVFFFLQYYFTLPLVIQCNYRIEWGLFPRRSGASHGIHSALARSQRGTCPWDWKYLAEKDC